MRKLLKMVSYTYNFYIFSDYYKHNINNPKMSPSDTFKFKFLNEVNSSLYVVVRFSISIKILYLLFSFHHSYCTYPRLRIAKDRIKVGLNR